MALRDLIRQQAQRALTVGGYLQDIPETVEYYPAAEAGTFDPASQTSSTGAAPKTVDVVFADFRSMEVDNVNILPEDKAVYIADLNLEHSALAEPVIDDRLLQLDGHLWKVVRVMTDPVKAVFILQVRNP